MIKIKNHAGAMWTNTGTAYAIAVFTLAGVLHMTRGTPVLPDLFAICIGLWVLLMALTQITIKLAGERFGSMYATRELENTSLANPPPVATEARGTDDLERDPRLRAHAAFQAFCKKIPGVTASRYHQLWQSVGPDVTHIATDDDGAVFAYRGMPQWDQGAGRWMGHQSGFFTLLHAGRPLLHGNGAHTLESRPVTATASAETADMERRLQDLTSAHGELLRKNLALKEELSLIKRRRAAANRASKAPAKAKTVKAAAPATAKKKKPAAKPARKAA